MGLRFAYPVSIRGQFSKTPRQYDFAYTSFDVMAYGFFFGLYMFAGYRPRIQSFIAVILLLITALERLLTICAR